MKKRFLLWIFVSISSYTIRAQMVLSAGNQFVQTGGYVVLQNMSLVNDGAINAAGGTVSFSGSSNNTISGTSSPAFYILEINKNTGNQLILQQNISINNSINFLSGLIDLSGNNIILNGSAYLNNETETSRITGTTGGYVQATATLNAPSAVNPGNLGAIITTAQNMGLTVIRRGHVSQQNAFAAGNSIYRYYDILPASVPASLTLQLNYFDAELNGLNESDLNIWKSNDTLHWFLQGYTFRDASANYVTYNGITTFNQRWTLSTVDNVLPIGLISFKVNCQADAVNLKWNTAGNINSGVFEVQRSNDGVQWQTIATIQAGSANQYSYTDESGNSKSFYRLKLPAEDNTVSYSDIKSSGCAVFNNKAIIYPNPAINYLKLELNNMPDQELSLAVYTGNGQMVLQKNIYVTGTSATYTLPVTGLAPGVYHVSVQSPGYRKTFAFVKE